MLETYDLSLSPTGRLSDHPDVAKYGPPFKSLQDAKKWQKILLRPLIVKGLGIEEHREKEKANREKARQARLVEGVQPSYSAGTVLKHQPTKRQDSIAANILAYGMIVATVLAILAFAYIFYSR